MSPNQRGGGHIVIDSDPVGIGVSDELAGGLKPTLHEYNILL